MKKVGYLLGLFVFSFILIPNIFAAPPASHAPASSQGNPQGNARGGGGGVTGAIYTTDVNHAVNRNIYERKDDVYLRGQQITDGYYFCQVTDPSGSVVLGRCSQNGIPVPLILVQGGTFQDYQLVEIMTSPTTGQKGYDDTPNNGGEYKVQFCNSGDFNPAGCKFDNFKVRRQELVEFPVEPEVPTAAQPPSASPSEQPTPTFSSPTGEIVSFPPSSSTTVDATPASASPSELSGTRITPKLSGTTATTSETPAVFKFTPKLNTVEGVNVPQEGIIRSRGETTIEAGSSTIGTPKLIQPDYNLQIPKSGATTSTTGGVWISSEGTRTTTGGTSTTSKGSTTTKSSTTEEIAIVPYTLKPLDLTSGQTTPPPVNLLVDHSQDTGSTQQKGTVNTDIRTIDNTTSTTYKGTTSSSPEDEKK